MLNDESVARGERTMARCAMTRPSTPTTIARHMKLARAIARDGQCADWREVVAELEKEHKGAAHSLSLWAGVGDRDELDRLCKSARLGLPKE